MGWSQTGPWAAPTALASPLQPLILPEAEDAEDLTYLSRGYSWIDFMLAAGIVKGQGCSGAKIWSVCHPISKVNLDFKKNKDGKGLVFGMHVKFAFGFC